MPKQKNDRKTTVELRPIVQMALLPEIVEAVETLIIAETDVLPALLDLVSEGYSITFSRSEEYDNYSVKLSCDNPNSPNNGKILYANGDDLSAAACAMYGKHFLQSADGKWVDTTRPTGRFS